MPGFHYSLLIRSGFFHLLAHKDQHNTQYHDTDTAEATSYFNPDRYREGMVVLAIRQRYDGWLMTGTAGIGRQWVNSDPSTETRLLEAAITTPAVGRVYGQARVGYSRSAGYQGPDYSYRYASGEMVFPF